MFRHRTVLPVLAFASLFLLAAAVPLAPGGSRKLHLDDDVVLNGQVVPRGIYMLTWETHENPGEVRIAVVQGRKKVVASATGRWVRREKSPHEAIVTRRGFGSAPEFVEIRFRDKEDAIRLEP